MAMKPVKNAPGARKMRKGKQTESAKKKPDRYESARGQKTRS